MNNANLAVTETRHRFEVSLLHVFDEIARNLLKASHKRGYVSLQSYLDGGVAIGDAYFTRRAILLALERVGATRKTFLHPVKRCDVCGLAS
jgi:hypothetical protein